MFSAIRSRMHLSPTAAVATLALVFAMSGGAYAASRYVITSTKQISPKVLKSLQGKAGAAGASGAAGTQGAAGPQGPAGPAGPQGNEGPQGKEGTAGKNGEKGKEGSPWTAGGTLPAGKTETGTWAFTAAENAGKVLVPISFAIPLAKALEKERLHYVTFAEAHEGTAPAECPGSAADPEAASGNLCVYVVAPYEAAQGTFDGIFEPASFGTTEGADTAGALLEFTAGAGEPKGWGTWAVTG